MDAESTSHLEDYDIPRTPIKINQELPLSSPTSELGSLNPGLYDTPRRSKFFGQQIATVVPPVVGSNRSAEETKQQQLEGFYDRPRSGTGASSTASTGGRRTQNRGFECIFCRNLNILYLVDIQAYFLQN